jgi:hypothetical protein
MSSGPAIPGCRVRLSYRVRDSKHAGNLKPPADMPGSLVGADGTDGDRLEACCINRDSIAMNRLIVERLTLVHHICAHALHQNQLCNRLLGALPVACHDPGPRDTQDEGHTLYRAVHPARLRPVRVDRPLADPAGTARGRSGAGTVFRIAVRPVRLPGRRHPGGETMR